MENYITVQGDFWDLIAFKVYGTENYMPKLLKANKHLRDVVIFPSGTEIICPDPDVKTSAILPPWKK